MKEGERRVKDVLQKIPIFIVYITSFTFFPFFLPPTKVVILTFGCEGAYVRVGVKEGER